MTQESVNQEQVLEEPVSKQAEPPEELEPIKQPEPSAFNPEQEARIQQMLSQATQEATRLAVEAGRRQLQSEQDRNRSERVRRERAEAETNAYRAGFSSLDEDVRNQAELTRYREQEKTSTQERQREEFEQAQVAYFRQLEENSKAHLKSLGIDENDSRVDWARDEQDYLKGRSRFDASVSKIIVEDRKKSEDTLRKSLLDEVQKQAQQTRKDLGLDSVDTTQGGAGNPGDKDFIKGMEDGTLPLTKENQNRLLKLQGMI